MRAKIRRHARSRKSATHADYIVFISYSTPDSWIAHVMKEKVEALGARAYIYETDMAGGGIIVEEIIEAIDTCREAIVLISPNTLRKPDWVIFEIGAVRGQHKRVTPILNNVDPQEIGPTKDIKGVDLNRFEHFLRQLKRRVDQHASRKK